MLLPPNLVDDTVINSTEVDNFFKQTIAEATANLTEAQSTMSEQANKHRVDKDYAIGDLVMLSSKNFRQRNKFQELWLGPYKVIKKIGEVAYMLELPSTSRCHNVYHVNLLEPPI